MCSRGTTTRGKYEAARLGAGGTAAQPVEACATWKAPGWYPPLRTGGLGPSTVGEGLGDVLAVVEGCGDGNAVRAVGVRGVEATWLAKKAHAGSAAASVSAKTTENRLRPRRWARHDCKSAHAHQRSAGLNPFPGSIPQPTQG